MNGYGFHWTKCPTPSSGGGGLVTLAVVVVVAVLAGQAVATAAGHVADWWARVTGVFAGAATGLGWAVVATAVAAVATVTVLATVTRRMPKRTPPARARWRSPDELAQTPVRPVVGTPHVTQAERAELAALVAAVPMPERVSQDRR